MHLGKVLTKRNGLIIVDEGVVETIQFLQCVAPAEIGFDVFVIDADRVAQAGMRLMGPIKLDQAISPVEVDVSLLAIDGNREVIICERFVQAAQGLERGPLVGIGERVAWIKCDGLVIGLDGFGETMEVPQDDAAIVAGHGIIGFEDDGFVKVGQRLRQSFHVLQQGAAVEIGVRVVGLEVNRRFKMRQRFFQTPLVMEDARIVGVNLIEIRFHLQRSLQKPFGVL